MTENVKTPNQAAIKFIQSMRRIAIGRCSRRFPEPGCALEVTAQGTLTCHAEPGPVTCDDVQTYRTRFELDGTRISTLDAELVAMGEPLEGAGQ